MYRQYMFYMDIQECKQHTAASHHFIRPDPGWVSPTDSNTMAGRPEFCLSELREGEPEPPHRAANLTNGQTSALFPPVPNSSKKGPEKRHHRGDNLRGTGWRDVLKDEKISVVPLSYSRPQIMDLFDPALHCFDLKNVYLKRRAQCQCQSLSEATETSYQNLVCEPSDDIRWPPVTPPSPSISWLAFPAFLALLSKTPHYAQHLTVPLF